MSRLKPGSKGADTAKDGPDGPGCGGGTVDDGLREPIKATRLLAWVVAALMVAGIVSAGVVSGRDDGAGGRVVAAAGVDAGGVEVPTTEAVTTTTSTVPPPVTVPPTTTTLPPTTTTVKRTTTVPPTTKPPATTSTTTAAVPGVIVTVVNEYGRAVVLTLNGRTFNLAPGQQVGPVAIPRYAHGNDIVEIKVVDEPGCGNGDADGYFAKLGSFRVAVVSGYGVCQSGLTGPTINVTSV